MSKPEGGDVETETSSKITYAEKGKRLLETGEEINEGSPIQHFTDHRNASRKSIHRTRSADRCLSVNRDGHLPDVRSPRPWKAATPIQIRGSRIDSPLIKSAASYERALCSHASVITIHSPEAPNQSKESLILKKQPGSSHVIPFLNDEFNFPGDIENGICARKFASPNASISRSPTLSSSLPSNTKSYTSSASDNYPPYSASQEGQNGIRKSEITSLAKSKTAITKQDTAYEDIVPEVFSLSHVADDPLNISKSEISGKSIENAKQSKLSQKETKKNLKDKTSKVKPEDKRQDEAILLGKKYTKPPEVPTKQITLQTCLTLSPRRSVPNTSTCVRESSNRGSVETMSKIFPKNRSVRSNSELAVTGTRYNPVQTPMFTIEDSRSRCDTQGKSADGRESNGRKLLRGDEYFSLNQLGHVRMDFGCDRELSIAGSRCTTSEAKTDFHPMGCWSANIGRDKEIIENLTSVSEAQDRDVIKLTKELREANTILSSLHTNIESLQAERERSQTALEKVKLDYQLLQDEKSACQKQISVFKRYVGAGKIHDRRIVREIDQLFMCYDRLDQREKLMRKQISILEAELALVVLKLNVPKSHIDVAKSEKSQSQKLPVKKNKIQRAKVHHGSTLPNVSLTNKVCSKVPKEILNISNRSEGSNPLLSSRNESKSQKLGFRKFPRINMMANQASKEVSEIGKECKRLYEKGNDILKREAYSRRNQRINELLNSTTESIDSREHRSRCISSNEIGQRRLPDICPYAIYQPRRRKRSDVIWNDLSVVSPPPRRPEMQQHRKRAALPNLRQSKMHLMSRW